MGGWFFWTCGLITRHDVTPALLLQEADFEEGEQAGNNRSYSKRSNITYYFPKIRIWYNIFYKGWPRLQFKSVHLFKRSSSALMRMSTIRMCANHRDVRSAYELPMLIWQHRTSVARCFCENPNSEPPKKLYFSSGCAPRPRMRIRSSFLSYNELYIIFLFLVINFIISPTSC